MSRTDERTQRPGYLTAYAKHAGISKQAAAKQLARVGIDYLQTFDFADADRKRAAAKHADRQSLAVYTDDPDDDDDDSVGGQKKDPVFAQSQARRELFRSKIAELEFLERVGTVVDKEQGEAEQFRVGRQVRDALLTIPDRLSGVLAAETDQRKIHAILMQELRQALEALAGDDVDESPAGGVR
jgi:hypothetical protein